MLLISTALAEIPECEEFAQQSKYSVAADCYKKAEAWDYCTYYYLMAGRDAELAWDRGKGDYFERNVALTFYDPDNIEVRACVIGYGDNDLKQKMKDYSDWILFYTSNPVNPPSDITIEIEKLNQSLYLPPNECETNEECNDGKPCTVDTCQGTPKKCTVAPLTECINNKSDGCCPDTCTENTDYDCAECHSNQDCPEADEKFDYFCLNGKCQQIEIKECKADADCADKDPGLGYKYVCSNNGTCITETDTSYWVILTVIILVILVVGIGIAAIVFFKFFYRSKSRDTPSPPEAPKKPVITRKEFQELTPKSTSAGQPRKKRKLTEDEATEELERIIKSVEELSSKK